MCVRGGSSVLHPFLSIKLVGHLIKLALLITLKDSISLLFDYIMSQGPSTFQFGIIVTSNFILSILLVLINKAIVVQFQFKYMTVLSTLHFMVSALVCMGGVMCSYIPYRQVNNYFHVFRIALVSFLPLMLHFLII